MNDDVKEPPDINPELRAKVILWLERMAAVEMLPPDVHDFDSLVEHLLRGWLDKNEPMAIRP